MINWARLFRLRPFFSYGGVFMFQVALGVTIPSSEKLKEEFQIFENSILFNLSFEKLESFITEFIEQLVEPLFFVLEMPLTRQEEDELRVNSQSPFHKKVCYLDGQSREQIMSILNTYGDLLLNDGMSQFAIYSHNTNDGVYIQKYKVIVIFSHTPQKYISLLEKNGVVQTDSIFTAWDTFSQDSPGQVQKIEMDGIDIFDVYDELVKMGMYIAKVVED